MCEIQPTPYPPTNAESDLMYINHTRRPMENKPGRPCAGTTNLGHKRRLWARTFATCLPWRGRVQDCYLRWRLTCGTSVLLGGNRSYRPPTWNHRYGLPKLLLLEAPSLTDSSPDLGRVFRNSGVRIEQIVSRFIMRSGQQVRFPLHVSFGLLIAFSNT